MTCANFPVLLVYGSRDNCLWVKTIYDKYMYIYNIVILISDYVFKIDLSYESINEISCYTNTYESISVHNYEQVGGVA
jgi:hypothetical protein